MDEVIKTKTEYALYALAINSPNDFHAAESFGGSMLISNRFAWLRVKRFMNSDKLVEVVKEELRRRGYEEIESSMNDGGQWTHPDWEGATDGLTVAMIDCFERESE